MSFKSARRIVGGLLIVALPAVAGCTATPNPPPDPVPPRPGPAMRLVAYDSCDELARELRKAARESVGPYGIGPDHPTFMGAEDGMRAQGAEKAAAPAAAGAGSSYSQTNNHERDADEPDRVKTDGRRIVTLDERGRLTVVDAASRRATGQLDLKVYGDPRILLAGDVALILTHAESLSHHRGEPADDQRHMPYWHTGTLRLITVNLAGSPRVVSDFTADGSLVDARLIGSTARVVVGTQPRIALPELEERNVEKRKATYRQVIDSTPAEAWLPRYEITARGRTQSGRVDCERVSRPANFSGRSLVTLLSFDLSRAELGNGDPVSVVADGDTVYATATSLYVANDQRAWAGWGWGRELRPTDMPRTEIYRFDIAGAGRPTYAASGSVPGWLINQYAMSEWNGHVRVATTIETGKGPSRSAVHVLRQQGDSLVQVGKVDGLGKGERIYSVRFLGPRGYVVTFRETDPLYTIDLADPAKPRTTGELKITGYSSHLQPAGENRLIGVGQEATTRGMTTGTQVSLFDVADPAKPRRLAQHHVRYGHSDAEYDPHALLYWPARSLLVMPLNTWVPSTYEENSTALVLRVTDSGITKIGSITHPADTRAREEGHPGIVRSLVVGDVLWTLSGHGLRATDMASMKSLGWVSLS